MNQIKSSDNQNSGADERLGKTSGEILREAREKQKMDLSFAAAELRLTVNYVRALEGDQYDSLPAQTFVVGYLKSYAKLLSIPSDELLAAFRSYAPPEDELSAPKEAEKVSLNSFFGPNDLKRFLRQHRKLFISGAVILFVWIAGYLIFYDSGSSSPADTEVEQTEVMANDVAKDSEDQQAQLGSGSVDLDTVTSNVENTDAADQASAIIVANDADTTKPASAIEPAETVTVDVPADNSLIVDTDAVDKQPENRAGEVDQFLKGDSLSVHFIDDCWLEVVDADGKVLAKNLYKRGDRISLQGASPFNVLFGNARVVSVALNGEAFALNPDAGRKRLRLTIGE